MRTELSEQSVRTLPVKDGKTETLYWDSAQDGLCLRVRENGDRRYLVRYLFAGREHKLAIGSLSETTLADARHRAYEIRRSAKDGIDPRVKLRPVASHTLRDMVTSYLAHIKPRVAKSTSRQNNLYLTGPYFAPLHGMDIGKITQADVAARLKVIEKTHKGTMNDGRNTAHAARSMLNTFYNWLNHEGHFPVAFYNPVMGTLPPADRKYKDSRIRERVLSGAELAAIWKACADEEGRCDRFGQIVRLLILSGCRRQEVGGLLQAEVDVANRSWTIPKERYKTHRAHTVYLTPTALALATSMTNEDAEFQHWSHCKAALDKRLGNTVAKWTLHDLRRTMRSGMAELDVPDNIAEMAIGHAQSVISRTYNKHQYADKLRAAFEKWAEHVAKLVGDNVQELRRAS